MKKAFINIIINFLGAIIVFAIFSFHEFLDWIVTTSNDYHYFLLPWWGWGLIGFLAFEIVYFLVLLKRKNRLN
ncbi:MAG: hypothetical protein CVV60_02870 [Tenericutes bacterium HGW-Tenericutes-5]|nr:MAG: hypothetical protein CVV60_02870 [Tenericutes bacterium HGW-Tenericutes-5]